MPRKSPRIYTLDTGQCARMMRPSNNVIKPDSTTPTQLILLMRRYHIRPAEETPPIWDGPFVNPVIRLRPQPGRALVESPVERYDPWTERFEKK